MFRSMLIVVSTFVGGGVGIYIGRVVAGIWILSQYGLKGGDESLTASVWRFQDNMAYAGAITGAVIGATLAIMFSKRRRRTEK